MLVPKLNEGSSLEIASDSSARPVRNSCSLLITSMGAGLSATVRWLPRRPVEITVTVSRRGSSVVGAALANGESRQARGRAKSGVLDIMSSEYGGARRRIGARS
ncbi:hypothetical protein D3C79_971920 [compost metagenome]